MRIKGRSYQSIWIDPGEPENVKIIDQARLPFSLEIKKLCSAEDVYDAIYSLSVRGAPAIGAAGAYGMYLAALEMSSATRYREHMHNAAHYLISCRPTAVNLSWAVTKVLSSISDYGSKDKIAEETRKAADEICQAEIDRCREIGNHGIKLLRETHKRKNGSAVNILTHCNAGWLACVDYGTVTAPVYMARDEGIPVHVWVSETRPRNQGARLTCFELANENISHTLVTDNECGLLMQKGMVDIVLTGSDRVARNGDSANKIGTYLKALAAYDNNIPYYIAVPSSSFDLSITEGPGSIPLEERDPGEVLYMEGLADGKITRFRICEAGTDALNHAFDITPARLIKGFITEKGIVKPDEKSILEKIN